ncbi:MAG: signal peptidase I [Chloroherpetonaceae bacterium]|nr:signal peptidase I [Chloroherpetonaceae bacterium]
MAKSTSKKKSAETGTETISRNPTQLAIYLVKEYGPLVVLVLFVNVFFVQAYSVPTGSMEKTIYIGDYFFVSKLTYGPRLPFIDYRLPGLKDPKAGDIVVFVQPRTEENYIKRCVAAAGDTLEIRNRDLYLNGEIIPLPPNGQFIGELRPQGFSDEGIFPKYTSWNKDFYGPIRIPKKGDRITLTPENYSLYNWLIEYDGHTTKFNGGNILIDGQPRFEYTVEQDYYFMVGDNRDNSLDSRYWGFVPASHIAGSPLFIYWSWNPDISILTSPVEKLASVRWRRLGKFLE